MNRAYAFPFLQSTITSRNNKVSPLQMLSRHELVEQELLTLPEHMSSPLVFSGVRATRSLVLCVYFVDRCLSFCSFFWPLCLSVLLYTDSDCPFDIFKPFL